MSDTMGNPAQNGDGGTLRSEPSQHHSFVRFCNRTRKRADVIWFNYSGQGVKYKTLLPTQSVDVNTFVGHPWTFRDHDTGDRLVVQMNEVFQPQGYQQPLNWPLSRRTVFITLPVLSLYDTCLKRVRNLTSHQSMASLLHLLEEHLPGHIIHELIKQHKMAAIYFRMARGAYYGASSTSLTDVQNAPQVEALEVGAGAEVSSSSSSSTSSSTSSVTSTSTVNQPGSNRNSNSNRSDSDDGAVASTSSTAATLKSVTASSASSSASSSSAVASTSTSPSTSFNLQASSSSFLSVNERHAHTSRTLGLLSPCTVTTHSLPPRSSASNSPSTSAAGNGGEGLLSVQENFASASALMMSINTDSRDSLLEYDDKPYKKRCNNEDHVADDDDEDIFSSSCSSNSDVDSCSGDDDTDQSDNCEDSGEEKQGSSDINDSGLGNGDAADNNNELKCGKEAISEVTEKGGVKEEGGATLE